jgi:Gpi18-like mannosyltransferase
VALHSKTQLSPIEAPTTFLSLIDRRFLLGAYGSQARIHMAVAWLARTIVTASFIAGLACRYAALDQVTADTTEFLLPWYEFAHSHGLASLGHTFTDYTPLYSYLLVAATAFHGLIEPWHLIKGISFIFEFGCALMAARLVASDKERIYSPSVAFAAVWLAPTVLFNGAVWGQSDAIWTFFILLSVYFISRDRPRAGLVSFAVGFSVKAQAIFLSPLIFALVLRRTIHWLWLATIPIVYLAVAAPAWLLGQPLSDILTVYFNQAETYARLSMNAANMWLLVPNRFYGPGVAAGMAISAAAGLVFSIVAARAKDLHKLEHLVAAAAVSLLLMPFVLPKMHDRYFYAFEVMAIILACLKPRFSVVAIAAQINGVIAYLSYYGIAAPLMVPAVIGNGWILLQLALYTLRKAKDPEQPDSVAFSPTTFAVGAIAFWAIYLLAA